MSPFLRIGLSNFDCGSCQPCQGEAVNPYCAVLVKEYVESGELEWAFRGAGAGAGIPPHTRGPPAPPRLCGAGSRRWGRACPAPPPAVVAAKQTRSPASHATSKRRVPAPTHGGNGAGRKTLSRVCTRPVRRSRGQGPHGAKRSAGRAGRDGCGPHGLRAGAEAGSAEWATDNSLAISLRISENLLPRPRSPWTCRNYHVLPNHGGWGEP